MYEITGQRSKVGERQAVDHCAVVQMDLVPQLAEPQLADFQSLPRELVHRQEAR